MELLQVNFSPFSALAWPPVSKALSCLLFPLGLPTKWPLQLKCQLFCLSRSTCELCAAGGDYLLGKVCLLEVESTAE